MSDQALAIFLRVMAVVSLAAALTAGAIVVSEGRLIPDTVVGGFVSAAFAFLVWVVAKAQPWNPITWVLAALIVGTALTPVSHAIIATSWPEVPLPLEWGMTPADFPAGSVVMTGWAYGLGSLGFFSMLTFGLLLFPDGRLPSQRWRWLGWLSALSVLLVAVSNVYDWRPTNANPVGSDEFGALAGIGAAFLPLVCFASLIVRYRRSTGEERDQLKWMVRLGSVFVLASWFGILSGAGLVSAIGFIALGASYAIGITKYKLYDIDVVVSRAFVYGSLALFIGAVYVGIVVGLSALFGSADDPNVWLGIGATVVIAILFQPVRRRMERVANRVVFGRRSTPYEVLSLFSQNVAAVDPDVLEQVARSLTEGTTATAASILVARGEELHAIATWPEESTVRGDVQADITHDGERLGAIRLTLPAGQTFTPTDEKLLEQVSSGLGLALRNLQLTDDLRARVDQLRESRRRIVSVQDQTRRKLERDLHDGAQQRLVALKIKIGIGESMAQAAGLDDVADVLTTVKGEADMTVDSLRTLARGIYPPLLEAEGLGPALTTQLHRQPIPVTVQAAGVGRHPREIESTVYFCVLEAVQNSIRHAQAQSVLATVAESNSHLTFEVRDDGIGFDPDKVTKGPGLVNLNDRLDALEGTLEIKSVPGGGTSVRGIVPVGEVGQA